MKKLNRLQLRRLIEATVTAGPAEIVGFVDDNDEQKEKKYANKAEKQHAESAAKEKEDQLIREIIFQIHEATNLNRTLRKMTGTDDDKAPKNLKESLVQLEKQLSKLFDPGDKVMLNKVGLAFMKRDNLSKMGITANPGNLGDYLNQNFGYDNIKKHPHIYALYQENV